MIDVKPSFGGFLVLGISAKNAYTASNWRGTFLHRLKTCSPNEDLQMSGFHAEYNPGELAAINFEIGIMPHLQPFDFLLLCF
jgi:hypothetical protein